MATTYIEEFGNIHELTVHAEDYVYFLNGRNEVRRFRFMAHEQNGEALMWIHSEPGYENYVGIRDTNGRNISEVLDDYGTEIANNYLGRRIVPEVCPDCGQKINHGERQFSRQHGNVRYGNCGCAGRGWVDSEEMGKWFYDGDDDA